MKNEELKPCPFCGGKAAGWKCIGKCGGLRWTGERRPEVDLYPAQMKIKWEVSE